MTLSLPKLFAAAAFAARKPWRGLAAPRAKGKRMTRSLRENGTYYHGLSGPVYFQKKPTRFRCLPVLDSKTGAPALNERGEVLMADFPVLEPWRRLNRRAERPGRARRVWLAEQRRLAA